MESNILTSLESADTKELLDTIDDLRSQGVGKYVDLPQIIVCGEQSSGKSSILEAISGINFPTKDTVCTRFPTEIILRRTDQVSLKFAVVWTSTSDQQGRSNGQQDLPDLERSGNVGTIDLTEAIEKAKTLMNIGKDQNTFSPHTLRVELSGPTQPNLTLVDLPGLYQAGSKDQSDDDRDKEVVESLVKSYMKRSRSIILAVVSAKSDFNNQVISSLARKIDKTGNRTLGLITKPDTLHKGSESERFYVSLALNQEVTFKLGWHVLRNRDYPERQYSLAQRKMMEMEFFERGVWASVSRSQVGVDSLIKRLSKVLQSHIVSQLPSLVTQIEEGITECNAQLKSLGDVRETVQEQRRYLIDISTNFCERVRDAIEGNYTHSCFGDPRTDSGRKKRLRAVIQNTLSTFEQDMEERGHFYDIQEDDEIHEILAAPIEVPDEITAHQTKDESREEDFEINGENGELESEEAKKKEGIPIPKPISRAKYIMKVTDLGRASRGRELPGLFNPMIVGDLFHEQRRPWKHMVQSCVALLVNSAYTALDCILKETSDEGTKERIMSLIVHPSMDEIKDKVDMKVSEILLIRHPITYNKQMTKIVQEMQTRRLEKDLKAGIEKLFKTSLTHGHRNVDPVALTSMVSKFFELDTDVYAGTTAMYFMQAYYEIARSNIIDDIATIVIEECLVQKLPGLFDAGSVFAMSDELVTMVAGQSQSLIETRKRLLVKQGILENGHALLKKVQRLDPNVMERRKKAPIYD